MKATAKILSKDAPRRIAAKIPSGEDAETRLAVFCSER
jgi:hypothetical protein